MEVKTKYKIGDKALTIRNDEIEEVTIVDYHIQDGKDQTLEERLRYVISHPKHAGQVLQMYTWYTDEDKRRESDLYETVEELLNNLKLKFSAKN